jgi:hypothetical protein
VVDLRIDGCNEVVDLIKKGGGEAIAIECDVVKSTEVQEMIV